MDKPLCSVIVPIYNNEAELPRCIESILNQDYKNFELILIDDGSTDNSASVCEQYANKNSNIVFVSKPNGGAATARNLGISIADGEYIFFADSDDYVASNFCSVAVDAFEKENVDIVIFGFEYIYLDKNRKVEKHQIKKSSLIDKTTAIRGTLIDGDINSMSCNKAFKKDIFKDLRYPEGIVFEDVGIIYRFMDKADKIYMDRNITYFYEIRSGSVSNKWWHIDRKINNFFNVRKEQLYFIKEKYSQLIKDSYATTGFIAIMADTFLKEENKEVTEFLRSEKVNLIHSSFPYSILFRLWYCFPSFSKKVLKIIFK